MAGHSKFKNIQHRKGAQDAKRAKLFTKLTREILAAAKTGGGDPNFNPRLRSALSAARAANVPNQRIDSAIQKATSTNKSEDFEEITYECYLPGGIALLIDALTDNKNRTSSELKSILNKYGGSLAAPGSVLYLFDRIGSIEFNDPNISSEKILEATVEAGGTDCNSLAGKHQINCDHDKLHEVQMSLSKKFGDPVSAKLIWKPKTIILIDVYEKAEKILNTLDALEDSDDVQDIYGNYEFPDEIIEKFNQSL